MGFLLLLCVVPLVLPLIFGVLLWRNYATDPLGGILALFALKPLLATPLVVVIMLGVVSSNFMVPPSAGEHLLIMLPGALLTILLLLVADGYRVLSQHPSIAAFVLIGDAARWVLPYLAQSSVLLIALIAGCIWTSLYAVICWVIAQRTCTSTTGPTIEPWQWRG